MDPCGGCKKQIKGGALECSMCNIWFDIKCSGADQTTCDFLKSSAGQKSSVHWHCSSCQSSSRKLFEMISGVSKQVSVTESKVDRLNDTVECSNVEIESKVDNLKAAVDALNAKIDGVIPPASQSSFSNDTLVAGAVTSKIAIVTEIASEIKKRQKRALNAVFAE